MGVCVLKYICYLLAAVMLLLSAGCSPDSTVEADKRNNKTVVWYLPSNDSYKDVSVINNAVNERIHDYYPDIDLKLNFINIHEYSQKISVYLSAGEQADIVWANDSVLSYINFPQDNIYKFLDAPIATYATNIHARLNEDNDKLYKIYDKKYFIPMIEHCDGLIPFIRIPAEFINYLDIDALLAAVNRGEAADEIFFKILGDYLASLRENGNLRDGVDLASVSGLFPMIGYETFVSTSDLIGYRIDDNSHNAVDMLNTDSFRTSQKFYQDWLAEGYIHDDISIIYKQGSDSAYSFVLAGAWGYEKSGKYYITMDGYRDNCVYIAVDNKYHPQKLFTDSAAIIPKASKMSEEALKILDLFYTNPDLYNLITFGIEGVHYNTENGHENVFQNNYRCFANIVPGADGILSAAASDNVVPARMEKYSETAGMFIPSSSTEFRKMLSDYTDSYAGKFYSVTVQDNSGSQINSLLDIYNER